MKIIVISVVKVTFDVTFAGISQQLAGHHNATEVKDVARSALKNGVDPL